MDVHFVTFKFIICTYSYIKYLLKNNKKKYILNFNNNVKNI